MPPLRHRRKTRSLTATHTLFLLREQKILLLQVEDLKKQYEAQLYEEKGSVACNEIIGAIHSLMQKERETHEKSFIDGKMYGGKNSVESCFKSLFPTHPSNK
jgi:hypothetical protein